MSQLNYKSLGFKDIIVDLDGSVLTICMNRAKHRNTLNGDLLNELVKAFELADRDNRVRVVILTAEPTAPAYCSGADITHGWNGLWDPESEKEGDNAHRDSGGILSITIYRCRKITIAAVNGHNAGIGMTALHLPFDLRFVWAGAKLTFPFIRRGIVPEATSTYLLPRLIGHARASSLALTGGVLSPDSPQIKDLYHQVLPTREAVYLAAKALADELAANTSQTAVAYTKALLQHPGDSIEENHLLDSRAMKILASSHDAEEGVRAFKERRPPQFTDSLFKNTSSWFPWWRRIDIKHLKSKL